MLAIQIDGMWTQDSNLLPNKNHDDVCYGVY